VAMPGSIEARLGGREKFGVEESVTFRSNLCASDEKEGVSEVSLRWMLDRARSL
jgi:hypothetical protein